MSNSKNAVVRLVKKLLPNNQHTVVAPTVVIAALKDDHLAAIVFSQCSYWSERTDDPDGWFYKPYEEWFDETRIKERTCRNKIKLLENKGWIQTMVWHIYGVPKLHIRVLEDQLTADLLDASEEMDKKKEKYLEWKKEDLRKRREKNAERKRQNMPDADTASIRQDLPDGSGKVCRIEAAEFAGSYKYTKTTNKDYKTETTKYIKAKNGVLADSDDLDHDLPITSDEADQMQHGHVDKKEDKDTVPSIASELYNNELNYDPSDPYATLWKPSEGLRMNEEGYVVLPPSERFKYSRFVTTRLAQYILLAGVDTEFEIELCDEDNSHYPESWVRTKNDQGGWENDVLSATSNDALRALRNVDAKYGMGDFNSVLQDCWDEVARTISRIAEKYPDENPIELMKSHPLAETFQDFLSESGVEVQPYDPDNWDDDIF